MPIVKDAPFFGESISDNITKTPEGLLVCHNVPVARVGVQKYLGQEIGLTDKYDQEVNVHRLPEDVFHKDAIASFEGKPVTDDHPTQYPVTPDNYAAYAKGHVQNVKAAGDHIVADLVIHDPGLISKIENNHKRQVSAGYDCDWVPHEDGLKQTTIRANHVAVVDKGRAGPKVSIKDSVSKRSKTVMNKKTALAKMFAAFAKDASPEEIAELLPYVNDAAPVVSEDEGTFAKFMKQFTRDAKRAAIKDRLVKQAKDAELEGEEDKPTMDERISGLESGMKEICDRLSKMSGDGEGEEDPDKKLIEEMLAEDEDLEKESMDEEGETEEEKKKEATDSALRQLVRNLAPAIAKLPDAHKKSVKDALAKSIGGRADLSKSYAGIAKVVGTHGKKAAADSQPKDMAKLGKAIANAYNPHYMNQQAKKIEI